MRSLKNLGGLVVPGRYRFHEPDPNKTFATLRELVEFVLEYRQANKIEVTREALQAEIEDWTCQNIGSAEYYCLEDGRPMPLKDHTGGIYQPGYTGYQGADKWEELHEWALGLTDAVTPDARIAWLETFTSSLPCGECRRSWRILTREQPAPVEGSAENMWRWSYERHCDIRRKLNQSIITEEEARALYAPEQDETPEVKPKRRKRA